MIFICAQPSTFYYAWQVDAMLLSFSKCGVNLGEVHIVSNDVKDEHFLQVDKKWSKYAVNFSYYPDTRKDVKYISSIRPHLLEKHWKQNPHLADNFIFYHDCDIALSKPIPNLIGPVGLYFDCHTLEKIGAKTIIKKEFKIANQEAGTSVASSLNSLFNIQITIPQIITKLDARKIFETAYFSKVFLKSR